MLTRVALLRAGAGAYARTAPYGHARLGPRPPACKATYSCAVTALTWPAGGPWVAVRYRCWPLLMAR